MRLYIFTLVTFVLLGFTLVACTRSPEQSLTGHKEVADGKGREITVYKSPDCSCCTAWEAYMSKSGFKVVSKTTDKMAEIKKQYGVPDNLQSCHTAVIDGYVIEGHVPAADVVKLLEARPDVVGLAAPGMPPNSPGMQPEGKKPSGYDVLSFDRQGNSKIFASY